MAASLNRVFLIGNLTRDPELRYVPSGTAVTTFDIAVNRAYTAQSGEKKEDTSFLRIVVWARLAEVCAEYLTKGSPVFVEGRLRSRSWETQEGQKRNTIEVIAQSVQFLRMAQKKPTEPLGGADRPNSVPKQEMKSINLDSNPSQGNSEEIPF
ncbi:MAG: single-stranded DNA-binding protein [Omnitrophica bacterium]|nr:single-stranded DNA-binding protein [Candidatus Omnitrophota bacterium]